MANRNPTRPPAADSPDRATGRAAVYPAPHRPFEIREYPLRPVKPDEALARVRMATICRSDLHSYHGLRPNPCPGILGHEIVGTIAQLGDEVGCDLRGERLRVGDRVTWTMFFHPGHSYVSEILDLPQKSPGLRKYGHDRVEDEPHFLGGFAEYCYLLPGTGILRLPDALTDEEAAPLNCGVATMIAVTEAAGIALGDTVVIQGLGLLGLYGCAIAKSRGARRVVGIDAVPSRLARATAFGADIALNAAALSPEALVAAVKAECAPVGADAGIEVCGVPEAVPLGLRMLRPGGRYIIGGLVNPGSTFHLDGNEILRGLLALRGVHNYHPRHLVQALDFVVANRDRFPFGELVDARFALDEIDEAFARAADHSALRAAVVPWATQPPESG
jgi:putative phosphonate catabolism associated alcohol dehydrogenase